MTEQAFKSRLDALRTALAGVATEVPARVTLEFEPLENLWEAESESMMRLLWDCEKAMRPHAETDPELRGVWLRLWSEMDEFCEEEENPHRHLGPDEAQDDDAVERIHAEMELPTSGRKKIRKEEGIASD